jgi:diguanylate cyclase (GGDEF)-like protein
MKITATEPVVPATTRQLARVPAIALITAAMALVFAIDRATGIPHVQHLYYVPIVLAAVRFGIASGASTAAGAILLYHLANQQVVAWPYAEFDMLQMAVFMAVGLVAAKTAADARRLHALAMTDDLTGLHNLRSFERHLRDMVHAARRDRSPLTVLVVDLDRLKRVNDEHGHLAGAEAVRNVGRIIAEHVPANAVACRYGGDEFVIAVPHAVADMGLQLAGVLRESVETSAPVLDGKQFPKGFVSISVGVACFTFDDPVGATVADDAISEELFRAADAALYDAKNSGRNRIVVASNPSFGACEMSAKRR